LRPIVEANPQSTFILIHFSLRYKRDHIRAVIKESGLTNVVVFLADECETCDNHNVSKNNNNTVLSDDENE
jgi:hypothetical protein